MNTIKKSEKELEKILKRINSILKEKPEHENNIKLLFNVIKEKSEMLLFIKETENTTRKINPKLIRHNIIFNDYIESIESTVVNANILLDKLK